MPLNRAIPVEFETIKLLWNAVLSLVLLILGWLWNGLHKRLDDIDGRHAKAMDDTLEDFSKSVAAQQTNQAKLQEVITQIQINYVQKSELRDMKQELLGRFDRLENLVIGKKE